MGKINLIYLMGTGRSGTTALATILGNHENILTVGEVNQFYEEIDSVDFQQGSYWYPIQDALKGLDLSQIDQEITALERHINIPRYLLKIWPSKMNAYQQAQSQMFNLIDQHNNHSFYLDSSKYVARALLLSKNENINLKIINLTRDSRGVIWSFKKKVQTRNSPIKTIVYYYLISLFSQLSIWSNFSQKQVLRLKYEDLVNDPEDVFTKLSNFLNLDLNELKNKITQKDEFRVPEIIGGNRLKSQNKIIINADIDWTKNMSTIQKALYYLSTLPLNIYYKYKL